jgi:general stress protein 26
MLKLFKTNLFFQYLGYSIFIVLLVPLITNSQQKDNKQNNNSKLISIAKEIMQNAKTCALITIDDKGRPRVRTMDPFAPEENLTVWFGTNSNSRKVKQIKGNSKVTLYYTEKGETGYVMIHGIASIVDDVKAKEKHWKIKWKDFYPDYPHGYMLIKVKPLWLEVISETHGIVGDSITWKPHKVSF